MGKKYSQQISALFLTFVLIFAVSGFIFPQTVYADYCQISGIRYPDMSHDDCDFKHGTWVIGDLPPPTTLSDVATEFGKGLTKLANFGAEILLAPLGWLAILILQIASLLTYLSGIILNFVVQTTVVDMAKNLKDMDAINIAWKAIRDIANMGFIFVLLYAAIRTILGIGSDTKKLIVNIVVVAILINFSLFFTKVVIDASNVLSIAFYDAIVPGALTSNVSLGLSTSLMEPLKITSLWKIQGPSDLFAGKKLILIGVMGTVVSLIAAFVFFAVAIMFVIRFVVLIFVLILSPLAFMGFILPQLKQYKDQWQEALLGQAFFAPIYFMLTWIVIIISRGLFASAGFNSAGGTMAQNFTGMAGADGNFTPPPMSSLVLLLNFVIMIVFLIASLIIAKQWADKAGHGVPGLTKWATGFAGGATLGMAGRFGRGTVGRAGAAIGDSEKLKERAARGGVGGMAARLTLATGRKTGGASFDVRGTPLGGPLEAGKAQKGGFIELKKQQAERETKFAASLAPSAKATAKNPALSGNKAQIDEEVKEAEKRKQALIEEAKNNEELKTVEAKERSAHDNVAKLEAEVMAVEGKAKEEKIKQLEAAKKVQEERKREAGEERKRTREEIQRITAREDAAITNLRRGEVKPTSEIRKEDFAKAVERSPWAKMRGYNYDAAAQIRKGKSAKDKAADILKDLQKEGVIPEEEKPETPPPTPPTPSPAPPTPPIP